MRRYEMKKDYCQKMENIKRRVSYIICLSSELNSQKIFHLLKEKA